MKSKIQQALESKAALRAKKIAEKYNGDKELFMKETFIGAMRRWGNTWIKDDKKRIYFNQWNMFYDFETEALEPIDYRESMDYEKFEKSVIGIIML